MNLEDIRLRCHIDEDTGCWIWGGALSEGKWPRIYAPNHRKPGSPMEAQTGRRAVWHLSTGKAIPDDHRVYGTCRCDVCLNPGHMRCGLSTEWGRHKAKTGVHKTMKHRLGARKTGKARSVLTDETYAEIRSSTETGVDIAKRLGLSVQTVSKARLGKFASFKPLGGAFAGLIR